MLWVAIFYFNIFDQIKPALSRHFEKHFKSISINALENILKTYEF